MAKRNHTAPVDRRPGRYFLSLVLAGLLSSQVAVAEDEAPHEGVRAMPSILNVGVPVAAPATVALAGSAGYGFLDPSYGLNDPGHRLGGSLGASAQLAPFFLLGVDAVGRTDLFSATDDERTNLYGEPRLTGRFFLPASDSLHWGAELDARLVGSNAPSIDFSALSPSLRGLLGVQMGSNTWLGAELGFHLNNSRHALTDPELVSGADRVTVGASTAPGVPFGVGVSHRLGGGIELLGEISGEFLVGADAPPLGQSPWGMAVGARHPVSRHVDLMLSADVSFSARPDLDPDVLVPVDPRAGVALTAIFRFGLPEPEVVEEPKEEPVVEKEEPKEEAPKEPEIKTSSVTGTVVDEGGRPLADVAITMTRPDAEPVEERTYANGTFEFKEVPEGPVQLVIKTPGFDEAKVEFKEGEERNQEVVLYPSLPAGQVKGEVRDLKGNPIQATIKVSPGGKEIQVGADGHFELELAPGRYTVRFEAPDLSPQKRFIRVVDRGVVVLNIALTK